MKNLILSLSLLVLISPSSMAVRESGAIIQVQRKIRMSDADPLPPKEYFVDLGSRDGVQAGEQLEVYRTIPVVNGHSGGPWHVLRVKIGDLRIDYVGETSSLAREVEGRDIASLPPLETSSFMLGDEVSRKTGLQTESANP